MINQIGSSHCNHHNSHEHVNAFIDLNGIPYLLGEYLDKNRFQQIDRSVIKSEINVDSSEPMRAVVDINIDDIGKRASDGYLSIVGNNTKYKNLLQMFANYKSQISNQIDVLRADLVVRVNYQVENISTGQVIRTMSEDYRIKNRKYFIDINPRNIDDNAVIVNFSDLMISTVDQFTHGLNRMMFRVTNVQLFYEVVKSKSCSPTIQSFNGFNMHHQLPTMYGTEENMYSYHDKMQNRQYIGYPDMNNTYCPGNIIPDDWIAFNRFYHFNEDGSNIHLHHQEINDERYQTIKLSAGTIMVNRVFAINPGHRIIFKFCIWKNDLTVVSNTKDIAQILNVPVNIGNCYENDIHCNCHQDINHNCNNIINPDYETLIRLYKDLQCINDRQNGLINCMMAQINQLSEQVSSLLPPPVEDSPNDEIPPSEEGSDNNGSDVTTPNEGENTTPPEGETGNEETSGEQEGTSEMPE